MIRHLPALLALCVAACTWAAIWIGGNGNPFVALFAAWIAVVALALVPFAVHVTPGDSDE